MLYFVFEKDDRWNIFELLDFWNVGTPQQQQVDFEKLLASLTYVVFYLRYKKY